MDVNNHVDFSIIGDVVRDFNTRVFNFYSTIYFVMDIMVSLFNLKRVKRSVSYCII